MRGRAALALAAVLLVSGCAGKPEPSPGEVLGSWDIPVHAAQSLQYQWGDLGALREFGGDYGSVIRAVRVPITVSDSVSDGWFEPVATLTWADGSRTERCDSNGGLHNRLYLRPNGRTQVITAVSFGCGLRAVGDPGRGAYLTITVKGENIS